MIWRVVFLSTFLISFVVCQTTYDAYFGKPVTPNRQNFLQNTVNATSQCTVTIQPCRKYDERRTDGSCVNPKYPSRGATTSPFLRMLPPSYGPGSSLRPARNGSMLPSTRLIRTNILADGFASDHWFSHLSSHVLVFSFVDLNDLIYLFRYIAVSDCCIGNQVPNTANPQCIPIEVPTDDPFLRGSGVGCMNLSRVETYQDYGCIPRTLPAERYNRQTPLLDLSIVYGFSLQREQQIRLSTGGLLRFTIGPDGVERPPTNSPWCINNRRQNGEISCYEWGDDFDGNLLEGIYLTAGFFFREHNRLARELAKINPCWDDQQLFENARKINIAQYQYIAYYELFKEFLGEENALKTGIIYKTNGYVNDFDKEAKPGTYHEYVVGGRWFHIFQDGRSDLYDNDGNYLGTRDIVDDTARSGILELNNTEQYLTQGAIRQAAGKFDFIVDPNLGERVNFLARASDLTAYDIQRGRDQGLAPYNDYRKICGMKVAHEWEDFHDAINPDVVEQLKRIYEDVDDVDVMAAIYAERLIPGGWVGPTLFCIMQENLVNWRKADRFFFEHGDIPASLTLPQLNEVRKVSMARILCNNGVKVDKVQPRAFLRDGYGNEMQACEHIPSVDLTKWADNSCKNDDKKSDNNSNNIQKSDSNIMNVV